MSTPAAVPVIATTALKEETTKVPDPVLNEIEKEATTCTKEVEKFVASRKKLQHLKQDLEFDDADQTGVALARSKREQTPCLLNPADGG